jgi:hypothetical protein
LVISVIIVITSTSVSQHFIIYIYDKPFKPIA